MAVLLGVVVATLGVYKLKWTLVRQPQAVVIISAIICLAPLVSFALGCSTSYGAVTEIG